MTGKVGSTGPTRTCVGCGRRDAQSAMLRLRLGDSGTIVPATARASGRSAYVHRLPDCVAGLARSKGIGKSLRTTVTKEARLELMRGLQADLPSLPALRAGSTKKMMRHHVGAGA